MKTFDTIVLGLGAAGSACAYQLTKRGARVLGVDQFTPPHDQGSTHGDTRITRLAIGEGDKYTPLAQRSHEIWREIEGETGELLLTTKGGLIISGGDRSAHVHVEGFFANTLRAAEKYSIPHERLDDGDIRTRFPQFAVRDGERGYYEPEAGFVRPEACVRAQLALARRGGAEIHFNERVLGYEARALDVLVKTDLGEYSAQTLIIAAGPWLPTMLDADTRASFRVYRQVLYWFDVEGAGELFAPDRFPIFIWELPEREQGIYGFPAVDGASGGVKIATEQYSAQTSPEDVAREVSPQEIAHMYKNFVAPFLPGLGPTCLRAVTCLYTVTPDFAFVIDRHPRSDRVIIASPCSGHGFKHSAAIGEAVSYLAQGVGSGFDLSPFTVSRFSGRASA